ncbi:hypothetical protein C8A03DRAFT_38799, partial [Achaetomium macrosporum]
FEAQYSEELAPLFEADRNRTYQCPPGLDSIYEHAEANVRMRWIKQGIWKDEWSNEYRPGGGWKHEDLLKPESETGSDTMLSAQRRSAGIQRKRPVESDEEVRRERREGEASRPYYQFLYHVCKERERIQEEMNPMMARSQYRYRPISIPLQRSWVTIQALERQTELVTTGLSRQKNAWQGHLDLSFSRNPRRRAPYTVRPSLTTKALVLSSGLINLPSRTRGQPVRPEPLNDKPATLKPVRPARVSKARKPGRPALSERQEPAEAPAEAGSTMIKPDVNELRRVAETPLRKSQRLRVAENNKPTTATEPRIHGTGFVAAPGG